jgi:hypothetical protein
MMNENKQLAAAVSITQSKHAVMQEAASKVHLLSGNITIVIYYYHYYDTRFPVYNVNSSSLLLRN